MIKELLSAGPVFWFAMAFIGLFIIGTVNETLRKRKLEAAKASERFSL